MVNDYELTDTLGEPRVFKSREIFPVKVKDADKFYESVQSILIQKNSMDSTELFKMSYLQFLIMIWKNIIYV